MRFSKNITMCRTFLYRLESYEAAAASANVYINTMRHFNQKRSHSIQKTMLEWTLCAASLVSKTMVRNNNLKRLLLL